MADTPEQTDGATQVEAPKKNTRKPKVAVSPIFDKLLKIRKSVDYIQKKKHGEKAQYNYTSSSQVLASVREAMNEQGVLLTTAVTAVNVRETVTKTGTKVYFTELWLMMTWIDTETGDNIQLPFYAQGVDLAGEKGVGKALTYGEKYFILKQFNIPTDKDDPDAFQAQHAPVDVKNTLIVQLAEAKDIQIVANIWAHNSTLQSDKDFKKACGDAKKRLAPKETEPKTDSKSEGDAG